jgi:pSer/pThr/pTyr-binding forkhead associated (FHA) protein
MFHDPQPQSPHTDSGERQFPQESVVPHRLYVLIETEQEELVTLSLDDRVIVGRSEADDTEGDLGLDLAAFGGEKSGVSRRHAIVSCQDESFFIEDLDSTNGTRINGLRLTPKRPYRLHDGDEIELGSARLIVRFVPPGE